MGTELRAQVGSDDAEALKDFVQDEVGADEEPSLDSVDQKTVERVTSWQADATQTSPQPARRLPFSSSLPPSSPPPPGSPSITDFNPPSPQQDLRQGPLLPGPVFEPDVDVGNESFASAVSDDFGFFAAQKKIHALRNSQKDLLPPKEDPPRAESSRLGARKSNVGNMSLNESFSGRLAFATPRAPRRSRVSTLQAETPQAESRSGRPKARRIGRKSDTVEDEDDEEADQEAILTLRERSWRKKAPVLGAQRSRRQAKGTARVASGWSAGVGRQTRGKQANKQGEEIDLAGVVSSGEEVRSSFLLPSS